MDRDVTPLEHAEPPRPSIVDGQTRIYLNHRFERVARLDHDLIPGSLSILSCDFGSLIVESQMDSILTVPRQLVLMSRHDKSYGRQLNWQGAVILDLPRVVDSFSGQIRGSRGSCQDNAPGEECPQQDAGCDRHKRIDSVHVDLFPRHTATLRISRRDRIGGYQSGHSARA